MTNTDWLGIAGKIAVVTGAAGGMGRAIATSLVEAGAAVALLDRELDGLKSLERQLRDAGGQVTAIVCDTGSEGSIADAAQSSADRLGPADIEHYVATKEGEGKARARYIRRAVAVLVRQSNREAMERRREQPRRLSIACV